MPADLSPAAAELLSRLNGLALLPDRLPELLAAYGPIFEEIAKLQALDFSDVHPAVIFEPTAPYRKAGR